MGELILQKRTFLDSTYLKESAHNLKKEFFDWNYIELEESLGKIDLNTALFSGLKKLTNIFLWIIFRTFANKLKFEIWTNPNHPSHCFRRVRQLKLGFLPRTDSTAGDSFYQCVNTEFVNSQMDITTLYTTTTYKQIPIRIWSCVSFNSEGFQLHRSPKTFK